LANAATHKALSLEIAQQVRRLGFSDYFFVYALDGKRNHYLSSLPGELTARKAFGVKTNYGAIRLAVLAGMIEFK
jgi:hypothetical protein